MEPEGNHRAETSFDVKRRYVRVCEHRPDGFIEFEFSIGTPELSVQLMLPEAAFHEFCLANDVIVLDPAKPGQGDWVARLNRASLQEIEDAVQPSRSRE